MKGSRITGWGFQDWHRPIWLNSIFVFVLFFFFSFFFGFFFFFFFFFFFGGGGGGELLAAKSLGSIFF